MMRKWNISSFALRIDKLTKDTVNGHLREVLIDSLFDAFESKKKETDYFQHSEVEKVANQRAINHVRSS